MLQILRIVERCLECSATATYLPLMSAEVTELPLSYTESPLPHPIYSHIQVTHMYTGPSEIHLMPLSSVI